MAVLGDKIQKEAAVRVIATADEATRAGLAKAADDRSGKIAEANSAAKKKYGDKVPDDVRKKIFEDPAGWLASNSGDDD